MTGREVVDRLLRAKKAERVALFDSPWADTLQCWVEQGYPKNGDGNPVNPAEHFGFDLMCVGGWLDMFPRRGFSEVVEETDEWVIRRNGAGASLKWWKTRSGTPEHIGFTLTNQDVWEREYRTPLLAVDPERINADNAGKALIHWREQGVWSHYGNLFLWEHLRQSLGDICMYESLVADPGWIHDFNRVYTDFYKAHYALLIEKAGKPDGMWIYEDLGYRNGLFCSPAVLEEMIFPYYKEVVDFFHGYDLPVVLHSCGGVTDALPLIVAAGFDGLNPMEAKAGCDVLKFAEVYGDKLMFFGGLDARILESGDRDLIRTSVTDLVEGMKARGARYAFGSDHSLSTRVTYQAFQYAIEVYKEHMMY